MLRGEVRFRRGNEAVDGLAYSSPGFPHCLSAAIQYIPGLPPLATFLALVAKSYARLCTTRPLSGPRSHDLPLFEVLLAHLDMGIIHMDADKRELGWKPLETRQRFPTTS